MKKNADLLRQSLNLIFAVTQILAGAFTQITGIGTSIQAQSAGNETPVIPDTYAFGIWGLIFLAALIYAMYQALPSQRENKLFQRIGFLTAAAFLGNTIWEIVAQTITFNWPTAIIITAIFITAIVAVLRLNDYRGKLSTFEKTITNLTISVLAGWVSVGTFANVSSVLKQLDVSFGLSESILAIAILIIATVLVMAIIIRTKGDLFYGAAVLWAFVAIFLANITGLFNPAVALVTLFLIASIVLTLYFSKTAYGKNYRRQ